VDSRLQEKRTERESVESMVGFAGFHRRGDSVAGEGLLKITQSQRPDASGYLTLTFILDIEGHHLHERQLPPLDETGLRLALGPRFEMAMDLPLRGRAPESSHWIEEIDLFLRPLDPFPVPFVSEVLVPVLAQQLNLEFEALSDWADHPALMADVPPPSIWQRFLHWLRLA
jgi:hypothetical protein